ncbi:metal-dependent hydrolase [Natrialbaceae archaeon GCM10025810]|uniref:metal-dependent hydrolase n=1 Tax=Halovalidus salilacus TaxID=3075124 RepID=UPI00360F2807
MYQLGHFGVALLAYAPVGAGVAMAGSETLALLGAFVCVSLSTLPDCDNDLPMVDHRGPTHTVLFALIVGAALAGAVATVGEPILAAADPELGVEGLEYRPAYASFFFAVGILSICSHLAADVITPMGIRPFWPISNRHYTLRVTRAANPIANYLLFGFGLGATALSAWFVVTVG